MPFEQCKESFKLKRMFLFLILAALPLLPAAASGQVAQQSTLGAIGQAPTYKYEATVGFGYTSLNQVNLSRHGLIGVRGGITRDWGKYFGLAAQADYYRWATGSDNPGDPSVYSFGLAPELHGYQLIGPVGAVVFAELGGEHTGGENITPTVSVSGGFGGGLVYTVNHRWDLRLTGDRYAGSFSLANNTPELAYSTHRTWNPRFAFEAVFKF